MNSQKMDSFKFHDIRAEKANAISRHGRRIQRITTVFRFVELFVFLIILSRFSFSFNLSSEYFRGISVTLISPRFVFLVGNAIVIVLLLISGQFFGKGGENSVDLYDEYMKKCRINQQKYSEEDEIKVSDVCKYGVGYEEKKMSRCKSENLDRAARGKERRRDKCRESADCGRKACGGYAEDEMSSEEFRRTVEAFIARQQRLLRVEEEEG